MNCATETEIILKLFECVDHSDWDALSVVFHPDVVYERPGFPTFRGVGRVIAFYRDERDLSGRHWIDGVVSGPAGTACWGRFVGRKRSDMRADERFADIYTFEDGRIRTRRSYFFRPAI